MSNSQNEKILLPQAGIPGFVLTPRKNSSEDIVGEYREEVVDGDRGLAGDKTGISAKITCVVALCWAFFQMSTASWLLLDSLQVKAIHLAFAYL